MLRFFFFFLISRGLDRTVLTSSCGPTPVLGVHGIHKKSSSLGLKNRFSSSSRFLQSDLPIQSDSWEWRVVCNSLVIFTICGILHANPIAESFPKRVCLFHTLLDRRCVFIFTFLVIKSQVCNTQEFFPFPKMICRHYSSKIN